MSRSRWEIVLDQKPIPVMAHFITEVAKLFEKDLRQWPPPLSEVEPQFLGLVSPDAPKPTQVHFEEALKLARWELLREFDAVDDYMRNGRWRERELRETDKQLLLFLSRWIVEQLLSLGEATQGRINRPRMLECLEQVQRRLLSTSV